MGKWMTAAAVALWLAAAPGWAQRGTPLHVVSYTVQSGDTISAIAEYFYGNQARTEPIAEYNRLSNVNRISVGQRLEIPFYDTQTWAAYAARIGLPPEPDTSTVAGGSEDVAVTPERPALELSRRWWAFIVYGTLAVVLTAILYIRSRRHEHAALGVGAARR